MPTKTNYYDCSVMKAKKYQLIIMTEDGRCTFSHQTYNWDELHEAMREMRVLYAKHGVTHHVGYREV